MATSPTNASVTLNPPIGGGSVSGYVVTLCPSGSGACITATCPTTNCLVGGLFPGTQYTTTAVAMVGGKPSAPSAPMTVTTPVAVAPAVTCAVPATATTAAVTLDPPANVVFTSVSAAQ